MDSKLESFFKVVLVEPEIPQNTGNIGRTCVGVNSELHLVEPLSFEISDKNLKRAGLDYWPYLRWFKHSNLASWEATVTDPARVFYFSTKAEKTIFEVDFLPGDFLVFGKETKGLSPEIIQGKSAQLVKIPQFGPIRSLNLATAVAISLYEGVRQLKAKGYLASAEK